MTKPKLATWSFDLGSLTVELLRDRIRIRDAGGSIIGTWTTSGAILHDLCRLGAGTLAIPSYGLRLYRVVETEDRPASIGLRSRPQQIWVHRGRILVAGRHDLTLFQVRPLAEVLHVGTNGTIDPPGSLISYPVAAIKAYRQTHVLNLSLGRTLRIDAGSAIGRFAIYRRRVIIMERERVVLVDGDVPEWIGKLDVSQKLRPETLRVGNDLAAVATRDTIVVADLEKGRLRQVQLSGAVKSVRLSGRTVVVVTSVRVYRFGPDGEPVRA